MKTIIRVVAGLLALVIGLIAAAYLLIPKEKIVAQVQQQVEQKTGRKLSLSNELAFSVLPKLAVQLKDVKLSSPEGFKQDLLTIDQVDLVLPWMTLFDKEISVEQFVLTKPQLHLLTQNGQNNWTFSTQATTDTSKATAANDEPMAVNDIKLGRIAIVDGVFSQQQDQQPALILTELNLNLQLPALSAMMQVEGDLVFNQQQFSVKASVDSLANLLKQQLVKIDVSSHSAFYELTTKLQLQPSNMQITGELALESAKLRELSSWLGITLPTPQGTLASTSFITQLRVLNQDLSLTGLTAKLDQLQLQGDVNIKMLGKPMVVAKLQTNYLNVNPYLGIEVAAEQPAQQEPQPIIWPDDAIDLSALNQFAADVTLNVEGAQFKEIKLGKTQIALKNNADGLNIGLTEMNLYDGIGSGKILIKAAKKAFPLQADFQLTGVQAFPLLTDAVGFKKLRGQGNLNFAINSNGPSVKTIIEQLNGSMAFAFKDGAYIGVNIAGILREPTSLLTKQPVASEETDFSALTASFNIVNGVVSNEDLSLMSPLVRVTGKGTLDLPKTEVDYHVRAKLVASIEGQGAAADSSGVTVPLKVTGPLHKPKFAVDVAQETKDKAQQKIDDAKQKAKDKLKSKLGGLIGG